MSLCSKREEAREGSTVTALRISQTEAGVGVSFGRFRAEGWLRSLELLSRRPLGTGEGRKPELRSDPAGWEPETSLRGRPGDSNRSSGGAAPALLGLEEGRQGWGSRALQRPGQGRPGGTAALLWWGPHC